MLDSPMRLVAVIIAGALVGSIAFLPMNKVSAHPAAPVVALFLALIPLSMGSMIWAGSKLRDGVQNERWPESAIQPLRAVVSSAAWKAGLVLLLACLAAATVFERRAHDYPYFWSIFCLQQACTQLSYAARRPVKPSASGNRLDLSETLPLHSEHWGESSAGPSAPSL